MSDIATQAREVAVGIEVKKDGLRQTQDGQWKITLTALELPSWLITARPGTRIMAALVEIGDDEQPVSHESPAPAADSGPSTASGVMPTGAVPGRDAAKSERAKAAYKALPPMKKDVVDASRLIKDVTFQGWIACGDFDPKAPAADRERHADSCMKAELHIESKSEIGESREVNGRWHMLLTTYLQDTNQLAEIRS